MHRRAIVILTLALAAPAFGTTLKDAEKAWQQRAQPGQTEAAIKAWESVLEESPEKGELYIALTKACSRAYRNSSGDEKEEWAGKARKYGALAVEKNPSNRESYARNAEALGQWAQAHKGLGSLKFVKQAVAQLKKSIAIDPHYAFAHMMLARFYEDAPGTLSVGDKKKALEHARLAVEYGSGYAINHNTLAKIYIARGKKAEAKAELEKTLSLSPPVDAVPETRSDQEDARELLKTL